MNTLLTWLLPALPLLAGGALAIAGRRADRAAPAVGISCAALTLAVAVTALTLGAPVEAPLLSGLPAGLSVDGLSGPIALTTAAITLAVLVYSASEFGPAQPSARFFGLMLIFSGAMLVTSTATTLVTLLMGWEVMGAASYALIGFWWHDERRVRAAGLAFLTTRAADLGLYLAAGAALAGTATLDLSALHTANAPWSHLIAAGVVTAALGKSAQLPFSFWLSRAMEGPSPVSALLHSATMVAAGAYLLLRLDPLLAATGWADTAVAWIGAATALALGAVALAQRDLKQLLAASTCSQLGFVVLAAGVSGAAAGTTHLIAHAATKSLLFLAAGAWHTALGTRDLDTLRGATRRYPLVGLTFAAGALTLAGLPPLSLWLTKDPVLHAAATRSPALYAVGLAAAALSALYAGRALALVAAPGTRQPTSRRVPTLAAAALLPLAALALTLGVLAVPPLADQLADAAGLARPPQASPVELALSGALAAGAVWLAVAWRDRTRPLPGLPTAPLRGWLALEPAARVAVADPTRALASALARFDDRVIDGGVRAAAGLGDLAARAADLRAERVVEAGVRGLAGAARWLGALARRPQTGQLHTYYAQAIAFLIVLVIVLVIVG